MTPPIKLAVFISGRGSNFKAILDAIAEGTLNAEVKVVVSDNPNAEGLRLAREKAIPVENSRPMFNPGLPGSKFGTIQDQEADLISRLENYELDLIVLAGYMRLLGPKIISKYRWRIINIHPSLLPNYPGLHAQRQALEDGARISGATVHWVDETLDGGPIIAQVEVPVLPDDTESTLSARILEQEHLLLPRVIQSESVRNQIYGKS